MLFISHRLTPQTVTTYLSAPAQFNKLDGFRDTTLPFVVKRTLQGFQKLKGHQDVRLPTTPIIWEKNSRLVTNVHILIL